MPPVKYIFLPPGLVYLFLSNNLNQPCLTLTHESVKEWEKGLMTP